MTARAAALLLLVAPAALHAQGAGLDRADALLAAGEFAAARQVVADWWRAHPDGRGADAALRARALFLRGRLSTVAREAEQDYLALAQGYPTSRAAPEALLRLGQSLLARGETDRAVGYLGRLTTDYPGAAARPAGFLWLARADRAAGKVAPACAAARAGLSVSDPGAALAALLRDELEASCAEPSADGDAAGRSRRTAPPVEPVSTAGAARRRAAGAAATAARPFALQSGAFRWHEGADDLVRRLRKAGFEPRLVRLRDGHLLLVRIGRYPSTTAAVAVARRVRRAGFDALVVDDAARETPIR